MPPQSIEEKEKEKHDLQTNQSANLEYTIVTSETQSIMPIVTFQIKEAKAQYIDTPLPSVHSSCMLAILIVERDRTKVHTGQEASLVPTPKTQGEAQ